MLISWSMPDIALAFSSNTFTCIWKEDVSLSLPLEWPSEGEGTPIFPLKVFRITFTRHSMLARNMVIQNALCMAYAKTYVSQIKRST
jgi:hypothetical protein